LALYSLPLAGGIAFMLLHVGIEGFCSWSREVEQADALRATEEEDRE